MLESNPNAEFDVIDKAAHGFFIEKAGEVWPRTLAFIQKATTTEAAQGALVTPSQPAQSL